MSELQLALLNKKSSLEWKSSQKDILLSNYDPFKFPADLEQAKNHGKARRICTQEIDFESERCMCCMLPIRNELIPLGCQLEDLSFLGLAYPLYFVFLKAATVLMIIHFLMVGIAELVLNVTGNQCKTLNMETRICSISFLNSLYFQNLTVSEVQSILNMIFVLFGIVLVEFIKLRSKIFKLKVEKSQKSPSDYSILIKGLPQDITIYQLQQFMYEQLNGLGVDPTVVKIYLIYDVKQYQALYVKKREVYEYKCSINDKYTQAVRSITKTSDPQKRQQRVEKAQQLFSQMSEADQTYDTIEEEIEKYQQSFRIIIENLQKQQDIEQIQLPKNVKFSGKSIITLNNIDSANAIIKHYKLTCRQDLIYRIQQLLRLDSNFMKKYKGQIIKIQKPPDASDVIFSNLGSHNIKKLKQRVFVTLVVAVLITTTCVFLTFSKKLFSQSKTNAKNPLVFSFLTSLLVAVFNSILGRLVRYFSLDEFYSTQSYYYYSVAVRVTIVNIVNMILATVMSNVASFYILSQPTPATYPGIQLNFIGLMNDFFFINATNSLLAIIFVFFDYRYAYRLLKRWSISSYKQVTQAEANLAFENQPIDMAYKYSHAYRLLIFTATVAPFIPNALLVSIGVIIIIYFVDKYLFLRRWMCQYKLGYALSARMLRILNMYPLFLSFSNFMIMCIPMVSSSNPPIAHFYISLSIFLYTLIVSFSPSKILQRVLNHMFNKDENNDEGKTYKQMQKQFIDDYSNYYPYFRVSKSITSDETGSVSSNSSSPRKNKLLDQTNKKLSQSVFGLLRDYIDHRKFTPKT